MKRMIILGSLAALTFSACRRDDTSNNPGNSMNATDQNFIMMASISNNAEVRAGELAAARGTNASVKSFGQFMVTEHNKAQSDLQTVASNYNMRLPDSVSADDAALLQRLNTLTGYSFDTAYIHAQVRDHQATLNLFNTELSNGQNTMTRNYAATYQPHIQMHLTRADSISHTL